MNENNGIAYNGKMIATAWKNMSTVAVFNADDKSLNFDANIPLLRGH